MLFLFKAILFFNNSKSNWTTPPETGKMMDAEDKDIVGGFDFGLHLRYYHWYDTGILTMLEMNSWLIISKWSHPRPPRRVPPLWVSATR